MKSAAIALDWRENNLTEWGKCLSYALSRFRPQGRRQAESRQCVRAKTEKMLLTNHPNKRIIKKPQGNLRTWGHRTRDFFGSPVKRRKANRPDGVDSLWRLLPPDTGGTKYFFSFFLRNPFRREVMTTVYITLSEFLLIGTFVLNLIRLLRDIYNKKK